MYRGLQPAGWPQVSCAGCRPATIATWTRQPYGRATSLYRCCCGGINDHMQSSVF